MNQNRQQKIGPNLELRQRIFHAIRRFLRENGFTEVETPIRMAAPAPEPHIDAFTCEDHFLQTSPELYMKRLLAAGYDKVFQICKCFRKDERGGRHLPEFTMLEWYMAETDYRQLMEQTENLVHFVCREITGGSRIDYQGTPIDFSTPWPRISVEKAFSTFTDIDMQSALESDLFDERIAFAIEPGIDKSKPAFLYDYPASTAALAKPCPDRPDLCQRFELYIGGLEICNGFTELTDAALQRSRFAQELNTRRKAGRPASPMPESFLEALPQMPDATGNALGLDRLVMIFANTDQIDDVTAFVPEEE